jgi:excinuclease ABC subunit C
MVVRQLRSKMERAAERLEFEKAAIVRDQIEDVERVVERQKIASAEGEMDVIAMARARDQAYVLVFYIRNGRLLGRENFILAGTQDEEPSQIMTSFVQQFYNSASYIPERILLQYPVEGMPLIQKWLGGRRKAKVELRVPRRGVRKELVDMVTENAHQSLEQLRTKSLAESDALATALEEVQEKLSLPHLPQRVECYDISNIQGTSAVGSMVVFEKGLPKKSHYRRFRIKSVVGADDYAMLREVLRRRFKRGISKSREDAWAIIPDLVLIDGGKGQLGAALEAMRESGIDSIPCASIAKEKEAIFLPQVAEPIILPPYSPALYFLQRVRDEAHRFALGYYHKVRQRESLASTFDSIPGVGVERKRALLRKFGSVKGVRQATLEELIAVKGMTRPVAERVKKYL